ncbi:putative secreted protein (Por secretion system target) [Dyadobacter jejuensis]|uniref:Putative secreted protein (Por secretion system target) n=1 Tax=Dyadobacter jejuensis TaxID=1082580 RepID=A0A316ARK9_9BACT|nr:T9SS type A sorting domain-containing protein [Dyadobacter jejuensis]PWJ59864.1 putative secreted protein (Por secretion system target) [Dyadobacter jejuensis]
MSSLIRFTLQLALIAGFILVYSATSGQSFGPITFNGLPDNKQLFAREQDNHAVVSLTGTAQPSDFQQLTLVTYRNNQRFGYSSFPLVYSNGNASSFTLTTRLKAELAEYAIEVYVKKSSKDSSLLVRKVDLVAGDFYIIYGQSNAVAWEVDYTYRHEYCRTMGFAANIGQAWGLSNDLGPRVGIFGIEFQKQIAERYQIPTCVINGALAGASIEYLTNRNEADHADVSTAYGGLLNMAQRTGLLSHVKGIMYWQGETEASSNDPLSWAPVFDRLMQQWQEDIPNVEKIYVFQLPLFGGGPYDDRIGVLREQQRTLNKKYPIIQPYAALGATGWNGFHYGLEGYLKLGQELADMAGYYHYNQKKKISSPSLQKAYYSTPERDEITLVFEDYQRMVYPKDTLVHNIEGSLEPQSIYSMKDFFYLNKEWKKLKSGRADANRIILTLKEVGSDSLIKYLPSKYHYTGLNTAPWVYVGPFLSNQEGFRALAFHHTPISPYQALQPLSLSATEPREEVELTWNLLPGIEGYQLDIYDSNPLSAGHIVVQLTAQQNSFIYSEAKQGMPVTYSIRAIYPSIESEIISTQYIKKSADRLVTGIAQGQAAMVVFPNPVTNIVRIQSEASPIKRIELFTRGGILIRSYDFESVAQAEVELTGLEPDTYLLRIVTKDYTRTQRILYTP